MAALLPQPMVEQVQSSSSSPHPLSILSQPVSRTFHDTPPTLLGLSQSRETPSLEPMLSLRFLLLSSSSVASAASTSLPLLFSALHLPPSAHTSHQPQILPLPGSHTDPCWIKAVKA